MAGNFDIKFNSDGFKQILCSDEVKQLVEKEAEKIAQKANAKISGDSEGFEVKTELISYGRGRWAAHVVAADFEAHKEESEDKVLTSSIK